jgi:hypothetical protein
MSDTQSVLDSMTAGILNRKASRSQPVTLTPVAGESPLPAKIAAPFPNDHPVEAINTAVSDIRTQVQNIIDALDAIDATNGVPPVDAPAPVQPSQQERERDADVRVAEIVAAAQPTYPVYEDLQREAQAAVFAPRVAAVGSAVPGWVCPVHGAAKTAQKTSRKGRVYGVCTACLEFEK